MKPGYTSTEFWLSLAAVVLAAIQPLFIDLPSVERVVAVGLAVLATMGYTASRAKVKASAAGFQE